MVMVGVGVVTVVSVMVVVVVVMMVSRGDVDLSQLHLSLAGRLGRGARILGIEKGASVRDRI